MSHLSHHPTHSCNRLQALLFLLCFGLLAVACTAQATSLLEPSSTTQAPSPLEPSPTVELTATLTSVPTSTAPPGDLATPLADIEDPEPNPSWDRSSVVDAGLLAAGEGWALAGEKLLWTTDYGQNWQDITPTLANDRTIAKVYFLNAGQGWLALIPPPDCCQEILPIHILHTEDGGQNWQESSFEASLAPGVFPGITGLAFSDPVHGWLVVNQTATMNNSAADLYQSTDGGLTWQLRPLPYNGPVKFITLDIGWTTGSCCTGAPRQLFRTADGGDTWEQQRLAPNPVEDGFDYHDYQLPAFFNERDGLLAVTLRKPSYEVNEVGIYRTADAGETWQPAATLPAPGLPGPGAGLSIPVQFLQPDHWIVALGKAIHVTQDAGENWEEFAQPDLPGSHVQLQFVTEQLGWSIVFADDCGENCLLLFGTSDGGKTWHAITVEES